MIKRIIKKIIRKCLNFSKIDSKEFIEDLRKTGIYIGKGTYFFDPENTIVDVTRPFMLEIGEYCKITSGCIILCHDYSRSVLRRAYNLILGESKKTIINNNVFLGMNTIVLPGSIIGNNVIVGAGSVVSGVIPDNCVIAGNPAKIIKTLNDHKSSILKTEYDRAKNHFLDFYKKNRRFPVPKEMEHYFPLFLTSMEQINNYGISLKWNGDDENGIIQSFLNQNHQFGNYEEFISSFIRGEK